jgi:hypothetical protein
VIDEKAQQQEKGVGKDKTFALEYRPACSMIAVSKKAERLLVT